MNQPVRIVLLEDEVLVADDLTQRLARLGYQVAAHAMTADEALDLTRRHRPDLVLSDIRIQGSRDGIEVADELQRGSAVPVVFLTAHTDEETLGRAKAAGPFGYILKPYSDSDLRTTIEVALERFRLEKRVRQAERLLVATLRSIGDAVIATDAAGKVTFMNPIAEELTGYEAADSLGRDVSTVFLAYDPVTHRAVESPVAAAIKRGESVQFERDKTLTTSGGIRRPIDDSCAPIRDEQGQIVGGILVFRDISERRQREMERERLIIQLQQALANVRTLSGLLPICAWCKKIRNDQGYWLGVEAYLKAHSKAEFSHSICPDCTLQHFKEL